MAEEEFADPDQTSSVRIKQFMRTLDYRPTDSEEGWSIRIVGEIRNRFNEDPTKLTRGEFDALANLCTERPGLAEEMGKRLATVLDQGDPRSLAVAETIASVLVKSGGGPDDGPASSSPKSRAVTAGAWWNLPLVGPVLGERMFTTARAVGPNSSSRLGL
jgi:hypothetical protein